MLASWPFKRPVGRADDPCHLNRFLLNLSKSYATLISRRRHLMFMVDKLDYLYAMLDDLDDDLGAMQEDLETVLELLEEGDVRKAQIILTEMNQFLIDFLEPDECDDEECECGEIEELEEDEGPAPENEEKKKRKK